jgi:hypothetical protein
MKSKKTFWPLAILIIVVLLLAACQPAAPEPTEAPVEVPTEEPTEEPTAVPTEEPVEALPEASTDPLIADLPELPEGSVYFYIMDEATETMGEPVVREVKRWIGVGDVSTAVADGMVEATVLEMGGNSWEPKFFVEMPQMVSGTEYTVSFVAYADIDRTVVMKVGQQLSNDPWWIPQFEGDEGVINLTTQPTEFSFSFVFEEGNLPVPYELLWEVGDHMGEGALTTVYVANIMLAGQDCCMADAAVEEPAEEAAEVSVNSINVSVEDTLGEMESATIAREVRQWSDIGDVSVTVADGAIQAEVLEMGGNSWEPKLFVEMPQMVSGTEYTVSFVASAETARTIVVKVGQQLAADPWWIPQFEGEEGVLNLTSEPTEYSFTFTFAESENEALYDLIWEVGDYMGEGQLTTVDISNVKVTGEGCCSVVNRIDVMAGDAAVPTEVRQWSDIGDVSVTVADGAIQAEVLEMGGNSWEPKLFVEMPPMVSGTEYTVSFVAYADMARTIVVKVGQQLASDPWWLPQFEAEEGVLNLTTEPSEYSFTFTFEETDNEALYDLIWEVGDYMGEGELTTVYISDVTVK